VLLLAALLAACGLGETPERARVLRVEAVAAGTALEVTQRLRLSPTMLEALDHGIPLRLAYRVRWCAVSARPDEGMALELRHLPLSRHYELRHLPGGPVQRFARRSALLAALDRVRLPLQLAAPDCGGELAVALDLTALPTPLRFPAFLEPSQWRLVSAPTAWSSAQG
jgi:hypothetical protein